MKLSTQKPDNGARKKSRRLGRGNASGRGKTAGRGEKGQRARKSGNVRPGFEGGQMPLYRRLPKIGFFSRKRILGKNKFNVINLSILERFENGATVDSSSLAAIGFGVNSKNKAGIKVLGTGEISKKLTVKVNAISATAKQKIEKAGGTVEILA